VDVPLSEKGVNEAIEAGKRISDIPVDIIFTSALIRAQMTAMLAMTQHRRQKVQYAMSFLFIFSCSCVLRILDFSISVPHFVMLFILVSIAVCVPLKFASFSASKLEILLIFLILLHLSNLNSSVYGLKANLHFLQVPVILHNESERAKAWSRIFSTDTDDQVIPVVTAWELNERM
jgi:hypothetical protein